MQPLAILLILLPAIIEYTLSAVFDLPIELRNEKLKQSETYNRSDEKIATKIPDTTDNQNTHQNQSGLGDLAKILGKHKVAQIRKNFDLAQNLGLDELIHGNTKEFDFKEPHNSRKSRTIFDNTENSQKDNLQLLDDYTLSNIGISLDTSHGHCKERIDLTKVNRISVLKIPGKHSAVFQPRSEASDQIDHESDRSDSEKEDNSKTDGHSQNGEDVDMKDERAADIETINKLRFISKFFIRDAEFKCTEGKYYKRGPCNICYCTKGSQWKPCTKVKCAKESENFNQNMLLTKIKDEPAPVKKLRGMATGCIPGQRIKLKNHKGNCTCICTLPSVMQCPLCAAVDRFKIRLGDKESGED